MHCTNCGRRLPDDARFCGDCGAPAPATRILQQQPAARPLAPATVAATKKGRNGVLVAVIVILAALSAIAVASSMCVRNMADRLELDLDNGGELISGWLQTEPSQPIGSDLSGDAGQPLEGAGSDETWTVLMYLCGSDLESSGGYATYDLMEIQEADLGSNVSVVIEAGGAGSWQNNVFDARSLTRAACVDGRYEVLAREPSASMGSSSTLADFIEWGTQAFPADHYMLMLWDHGGGSLFGTCMDELYRDDMLTVPEMARALNAAGVRFEAIGFDTCLMGTYENACALAPYADYLIASEEVISGAGWEYTSWLSWLAANTGSDGAALGRVICDGYMRECRWYGLDDTATLSCIDLSRMDALTATFDALSRDLAVATTNRRSLQVLAQAGQGAECYGETSYNMIDMADFVSRVFPIASDGRADEVLSAIDAAVVCNVSGSSRAGAHGLSMFYPLSVDKVDFDAFTEVSTSEAYRQAAAVVAGLYDYYEWSQYDPIEQEEADPVTEDDVSISYVQTINEDGHLELSISSGIENVAKVDFMLMLFLGDIDDYSLVYLGSDNDFTGSWSEGRFVDNFRGTWMSIEGIYITAELVDSRDGYNLYSIPVRLNGAEMYLRATYDYAERTYRVIDACETMDDVGAASKARPLQEGDEITFLFFASASDVDDADVIESGTILWHDGMTIVDEDLGDGQFVYCFRVTDVFGNESMTDFAIITYRDGRVHLESLDEWVIDQMG